MTRPAVASAEAQLASFLAKFDPGVAAVARATLRRVRALVPGAVALVYDAYSALSVAFSWSERLSDGFVHVAVYPRHVNLGFMHGVDLADPKRLLHGSGSRIRHIRITDRGVLDDAEVERLVRDAAARAAAACSAPPCRSGKLVIQRIYERQRPRRPGSAG